MKTFSLIAAVDKRRGIGFAGKLPWYLSADMRRFQELTTKTDNPPAINAVVMGRKTWESLPEKFRPLPNRLNVVLTRREADSYPADVLVSASLETALTLLDAPERNVEQVFIIGGGAVFAEAIVRPECRRVYLTEILAEFPADTFFPTIPNDFRRRELTPMKNEGGIAYRFVVYERQAH